MQHNAEISARISKMAASSGSRLAFFVFWLISTIQEGRWTKFLVDNRELFSFAWQECQILRNERGSKIAVVAVKSVCLENKRIIYGNWEIPLDELLKFTSKSVARGSSKCRALFVVT